MVLVLTLATDINEYVKEFKRSLKKHNYNYKLLGMGEKWEGFHTKMNCVIKSLKQLNPEQLVIICDSYDLLFCQPSKVIEERYHKLTQNKVVIGLESVTDVYCKFIDICIPETIKRCKIQNRYYPDFKYINAGFIMGRAKDLLDIYTFMIRNKFKDDQKGLFTWVMNNCHRCYFDYHLDFVFNYMPSLLVSKNIKVDYTNKGIKVNNGSFPCAVHTPGQYLDLGYRTENMRNFIIPRRKGVSKTEYFSQAYKKACAPEAYYIGYWWFIVLILVILICVYCTKAYHSSRR